MRLGPDYLAPSPPQIDINLLLQDNLKVRSVLGYLAMLSTEAGDFSSAIALFQWCRIQKPPHLMGSVRSELFIQWQFLAAKAGALALRNFRAALHQAQTVAGSSDPLRPLVDFSAIKKVKAEFDAKFERVDKLRHSVAHPEFYPNPDIDMTSTEGFIDGTAHLPGGITVQGSIFNDKYVSTINGITVGYALTVDSVSSLIEFTKRVFAAFDKASMQFPYVPPNIITG